MVVGRVEDSSLVIGSIPIGAGIMVLRCFLLLVWGYTRRGCLFLWYLDITLWQTSEASECSHLSQSFPVFPALKAIWRYHRRISYEQYECSRRWSMTREPLLAFTDTSPSLGL